MSLKKYSGKTKLVLIFFFACIISFARKGICQTRGMYPPFTKWYQDPLGLKPLQLSTAMGFAWGSVAVASCFIFTKNDSAFKKKISAYWESGYGFGYKSPYTNVFLNDIGIMYKVREWMSAGLGLNSFHFKDRVNNTWAMGMMPFARWYIYKSRKAEIFFQYGAGVSYSLKRFPLTGTNWETDTARTGTKFNLMSKYGCGVEFHITKKLSFQTTLKHFHLSNGNIKGIQRNPSHDSNGLFVAIIYNPN